jgi:hypothetical protein
MATHEVRRRNPLREFGSVRVEGKDSALEVVVRDAGVRAQRPQAVARIEGEVQALDRVVAGPRGQALDQELESPAPLPRIGPQPEQQRRVFPSEPLQDLQRCRGIRPRLRVRRGDLPAVGERRLERRARLAVDHRDLVSVLREVPGRRDADDPRAQDEHAHYTGAPSGAAATSASGMQLQKRWRSP